MNQDRVRVLFIVPDLKREGAQTQLVELLNGMDNFRFQKYLFTLEDRLDQLDRVNLDHVVHINMTRRFKYDFLAIAKRLAGLMDRERIQVVHCTLQFAILFGWMGRFLSKSKPALVAALHTTQNRSTKEELQDRLVYSPILRTCDNAIFVSEKQRDVWERKYPHLRGKTVAIHNGVDVERFDVYTSGYSAEDLRQKLGLRATDRVVACLAAFRPEKGHRYLIQAIEGLSEEVHLVLAGEGDLLSQMKDLSRRMGLEHRVHFLGNVKDVRSVLVGADVVVLASTAVETFSIAMLESMAMSVPVVATRLGGMEEAVIPEVTGALAIPGDVESLRAALVAVLDRPERAYELGRNARQLVEDKFTKAQMVVRTENLLEALAWRSNAKVQF